MAERSQTTQPAEHRPLLRPSPKTLSMRSRARIARPRLSGRHVLVVSLATLVAVVVTTSVTRARRTTSQLGLTVPVVLATQTIEPGAVLDATNTSVQPRPVGFVPSMAIASVEPGSRSLGTISPGEVLTSHRIVGSTGLDSFESSVLIPTLIQRDDLATGDLVQIYGLTPFGGDEAPLGAVVTPLADGRVLQVLAQAVVVAVPTATVTMVLETLAVGAAELVQRPVG